MLVLFKKYTFFGIFFYCALFTTASFGKQTQIKDTILTIKQLRHKATKAIERDDFLEATKSLKDARKLTMLPKYQSYNPDIELGIATLYYSLNYFEKATEHVDNAIIKAKEFNNDPKLAEAYNLYGTILISTSNYTDAREYLKSAEALYKVLEDEDGKTKITYARGLLALRLGNYKAAIEYFNPAIKYFKNQGLVYQEAAAYINLADALSLINLELYQNAIIEAKQAAAFAKKIAFANGFVYILVENHRVNSQIHIAEQNSLLAEKELRFYFQQKDSLRQTHLNAIEAGIQAESAIGDLKKTIASQKDDISKKEKTLFFGKLTGWLSIALILILSLLTLSLYKNNNLRAKANQLLQDKNAELQEAKEKAERASRAKAQFLSTITHELRTPMYTVTGLTHLLLEENPKPKQKEHLNSLKFSGEYLLSLINNLLDLNKLEANKVEVENIPFNLKKRIDGVVIGLRDSADTKNNILHYEYDSSLPEYVIGDLLKLSQILINLISNSIKFTKNGDIWLRVKKLKETTSTVEVLFEVQDTGDGVSKKNQASIFDSFTQGSLQINRKYGGTGLGLSIVKNLLELMGSKIQLESKLGQGSKFWFTLNYNISKAEDNRIDKDETDIIDNDEILRNKKILIVEDNKVNQLITKKILEKKHMHCTVVDNGTDAIKQIDNESFDIVLMDIHMPGISGVEATKKIREFNSVIPIIALTAITIEDDLERFYSAGFNDFISKPFKAEDFFEKITRIFQNT
ncbi:response regulator [Aequorivita marina]|uniref:response regulator n=1 Tax=Aequorivita marina TaxID=3073654 RepID=UPI002876163C|nr:response regulator [Aequorivita sp. S2608]MDS1298301.1 response regulator [Aequorivita sp. S2608]